ncbi:hypothetical protein ONO12_26265, partial [Salmonella enterica subsp. enterica serovar Montevideo]|nr:hypothetical protein [Salmonella enterica subsp. enterica serovar Montevideo]
YRGNVGELKNVVKYAVATAWAKKPGQETVTVSLHDLPDAMLSEGDRCKFAASIGRSGRTGADPGSCYHADKP